ncbi:MULTISPECIES: thiamine pyrophosphate-dependent enzyme [unclassified Mucilaginibacter]|uniref:thiamine pyrophosphate-dependent enzyme n=1 Tax=unclassified Mucilaginibacter TaxID=2617802 RepID=UPI002AC93D92|nr:MULTISPECIES: thiamine pyrophosphate-dependent enzyme [unclassified Mucilaginibacter]MEB0249168.1 thiamine pyrophosphate-dependent enzyme [Mucilaginibacter sp. 5B2]MEB0262856.1 thiamine pyrophosphate-dependent enzyme [Mucilaginibacter sp. 10I4]MEB0277695.1 thiamine pyrophosphate-dependent enzyme [Mucilaginibacter sp. 10B2]MEB0301954.1 thiamine pyrophosphate-dependent enzyme [Mucilaginibacter sp. 5C4]WPX24678.1 thiamine pyrophosphate-dependent enzyme [Mucilaginibacter sp. 5C4]
MAKVADQMVEMLVNAGIKRIYAVTGDSLNEVNDAVRREGSIQWIHVRHEEAGAYAAGAEAQITGNLACCAGSSGPGHVHLINGLYDAHRSGAPVIAIASTVASFEYGTEYFQETNTIKLFDDCSHYNQVATTPKQFPRMLQGGIQAALHRKGVSVIGVPGDLTSMDAEDITTSTQNFDPIAVTRPNNEDIIKLAALVNQHKKITIFCGIGAADAHDEVVALSQKLNAPVAYSFRSKMDIQYNNPNEVGMTGLLGLPSAYHSMHESNLLILLGTDFPYTPFMPTDCKIVQVDIKPERIGRRAKVDVGLSGSVKDTLDALLPHVEQHEDDSFLKAQLEFYAHVKENMKIYVKDTGKKENIHPEFIASLIDELATDDAIFTVDTGMSCVWGSRYINATGKRKMIGSFNHGSMANAMPQAIGAALAMPGRQVIALCGDGGLSMLMGDLATIAQYNLPIKIIVFNNRSLGMVKLEMEVAGLPDWQTEMHNPDFAMVAKAMGIRGITVKDPEEARQALIEGLIYKGPALINIFTDPNALAMPPKVELGQVKGMALSMTKLMLNGRMDEVVDTIKANYKHLKDLI